MPQLVAPHHSEQFQPLLLPEIERGEERRRAEKLKKVPLDPRAVSDVFMLATGAYTLLDGFMGHDDWHGSCLNMKLTSGVFWLIPITLSTNTELADSVHTEEEVALVDAESGESLAVMEVREKFLVDRKLEAEHVYRTADTKHSVVAKVLAQGDVNLAGPTAKTCPHHPKDHIPISGTQQREMLSTNAEIPPEFSRPEVVAILSGYCAGLRSTG